jgi:agarase
MRSVWSLLCALVMAMPPGAAADSAEGRLPAEALAEKSRLEFLFAEVTARYPSDVRDQVNEMVPRCHSITWAANVGDVNGELRIPVPPDVVRVWKLFDDLRFHGSGLGEPGQAIHFETPAGANDFAFWRDRDIMLAGHANRMPLTDETHDGYAIVVRGSGRIDRVVLRSRHGVSATFDENPWSTLGEGRPVRRVAITVDATRRRAIAGSIRLERDKFWRIASHHGDHPDGMAAAKYAAARGFLPGRDIWKLDGLMQWGMQGIRLREDPQHPGRPDYAAFDALAFDEEAQSRRESAFARGFRHANCFDNWPPFMALERTRIRNARGTPADFEEAARLASAAIGWQKVVRRDHDFWWEVKNESTISEEWVLHGEEGVDSWGELARFHNIMADTIHADHPDVLVGGPTSAWMALHHGGFELARRQLRFMDETKGHLDFYSHHFYEGGQLILAEGDAYSGGYLMGRLEGCLDLLRNHMELTGNVKPLIISETGTLHGRETEMGIWLNTKNLSSYLVRYMNHADKIDLVNLWLIPYAWWSDSHGMFIKGEDGGLILDERIAWFLELWKDYRGDRLPNAVVTKETGVHLHSVIDGRTVWVAINNLNPYRIAADVSLLTGDAEPVAVEQMRLYFDKGRILRRVVRHNSLENIPVAVEETTLVRVDLDREPVSRGTLDERTFYGDRYLQPTGRPAAFVVECPDADIVESRLRVCLSRDGGFGGKLSIAVNGVEVAGDLTVTPERKAGNYWGYVTMSVPPDVIAETNTVVVAVPDEGGYVTTVALTNAYRR